MIDPWEEDAGVGERLERHRARPRVATVGLVGPRRRTPIEEPVRPMPGRREKIMKTWNHVPRTGDRPIGGSWVP
jgi:hypothetical protein